MSEKTTPFFRSCKNQGFQIKFENGWLISVQFGIVHYCSNKDYTVFDIDSYLQQPKGNYDSPNAEIAVFSPDGNLVKPEGFDGNDDVIGFCSPDDFFRIIQWVASR